MLTETLKPDVLELIEARRWTELREVLAGWSPPEVADLLLHLRKADRVLLFRALPRALATDAFAHLNFDDQNGLLRDLTDEETRELLAGLSPDDRTHLLEELPGQVTQRVLNLLDPDDLREARTLLGYPEDSVGRLMTPDYVAVHPEWTIEETLKHIRAHGKDRETINRIYVTDDRWTLLDDIELRRVILAEPEATIREIMDHSFVSVSAFADREQAVQLIRRYDTVALPVTDTDGVLVGIVTVDDMLDVAEQEATEDFHRVGSVDPFQTSLRDAGIVFLFRRRIGWLLALVFVNILSGAAIAHYEELIGTVVALVFFLPLLIASAGNAGSQAATLMIRALATGDVKIGDWFTLLGKEVAVSAALGLTMAFAVSFIGAFRGGQEVAVIVATTMVLVVVIGSLVGMSLPFLLDRFRFDPATASAPLVTSVADIAGVVIYLSIASWYLGIP
ncbi:MAG: magnesium transporter [Gemmatimonadota bacterium]|nr:magnesium transporter [Gemmatimonadota bacterium]